MVKGISKQVIVVHSPDRTLFDQAIFILSDEALKNQGVSNDMLLREAKKLMEKPQNGKNPYLILHRIALILAGAASMGLIWLASHIIL